MGGWGGLKKNILLRRSRIVGNLNRKWDLKKIEGYESGGRIVSREAMMQYKPTVNLQADNGGASQPTLRQSTLGTCKTQI